MLHKKNLNKGHPAQGVDDTIHDIPVVAVGEVRQQLHDEPHQGLAGQPVGGAQVHHARVADQLHEDGSQPVVAAETGLQLGAVAVQGLFGGLFIT